MMILFLLDYVSIFTLSFYFLFPMFQDFWMVTMEPFLRMDKQAQGKHTLWKEVLEDTMNEGWHQGTMPYIYFLYYTNMF